MGREKRIYAVHLHMFRRLREMPIESETRSSEKRRQSIVKHRVRRCKTNGDKCETQSRILHADLQIARFWLSAHSPKHERLSNDPFETRGEKKHERRLSIKKHRPIPRRKLQSRRTKTARVAFPPRPERKTRVCLVSAAHKISAFSMSKTFAVLS